MGQVISIYYSKDGKQDVCNYTLDGQVQRIATTQGATTSAVSYTKGELETETQADGTVFAYGYDAAGNRTQVSITKAGQTTPTTTHYTYDGFNRLKTVIDASATTSYSYDAVGNLKTLGYPNGLTTTYAYNSINQLTNLTTRNAANTIVSSYSYGLDATGRRESITEQNGRFTQYIYDNLYRLTGEAITDANNGNYAASYEYDWAGNRTYETVNGITTNYIVDSSRDYAQVLEEVENNLTTVPNGRTHLVARRWRQRYWIEFPS